MQFTCKDFLNRFKTLFEITPSLNLRKFDDLTVFFVFFNLAFLIFYFMHPVILMAAVATIKNSEEDGSKFCSHSICKNKKQKRIVIISCWMRSYERVLHKITFWLIEVPNWMNCKITCFVCFSISLISFLLLYVTSILETGYLSQIN